jgi:hypothetical protein
LFYTPKSSKYKQNHQNISVKSFLLMRGKKTLPRLQKGNMRIAV